ncbi:glycosyl transferase family 2 [Alicyclobacillus acidocaldarius subsp. acidocaldarius Tc-4-1]|uniref:Glycosyl transferase family 2 n=2 Tax=Alicyclobacillus acidocaldarius TaxID=405212 RepID=F8IJH0_ALIAT|nr:glycosyl transferase family 2 [Alicyclobacillus acidocaldarius subsp. acidocaldarius Tc-4-1]
MNVPIPLGGTSNHFRTEVLRKVGAWDPFNVTEDADLGVRLYKHGYQTALVDSTTWEEANSRVRSWIRQRARWVKGYLITWLVNMRHPVQLWRDLGAKGFLGFQAMILGTPFLPLVNPFFWLLLILWFMCHASWIPTLFPGFIYYLASVLLFIGNFVFVYSNMVGMYLEVEKSQRRGSALLSFRLVLSAILSPLYWLLMSVATYRALWELIRRPFHWNKTPHGLTTGKVHLPSQGAFLSDKMG